MTFLQYQILADNKTNRKLISLMSAKALKGLAIDIKAEVGAGLLSDNEASESLNIISGVLLEREANEEEKHGQTYLIKK